MALCFKQLLFAMLLVCFLLHQVRFRSSVSEPDLVYSGRSCSWIITGSGWQDHLANSLAGADSVRTSLQYNCPLSAKSVPSGVRDVLCTVQVRASRDLRQ
ncbi:hypothetical protein ZIOFF_040441 [Zingiber officinale]|uniref:Secreted protein n=1 Tax=Zingiber officinale TaxID=94328 RepID=A0A8J5GFJ5_ZINOF|nr:hypothetical protein ZIOFF_040441 [Zingiber officinale]